MSSGAYQQLPGGPGWRIAPRGLVSGAPLTQISSADDALALVAERLVGAELRLSELLQEAVPAVDEVCRHLFSAGGKRFRPALTALGAQALDVEVSTDLLVVAELIHLGSLLHDDVVDNSSMRRGKPVANSIYGNAVAILSGDYCLAKAVSLAATAGGYVAVTKLGHAVTEMAQGEVLQLQREGDLSLSIEEYFEVIERKSAALISWAAAAAAYATNDEAAAAALEQFGKKAGVAFQIIDDVLDFSPSSGKTMGLDLQQRKVTLPLLIAMERNEEILATLTKGEPDEVTTRRLIDAVRLTGALDEATAQAEAMVGQAIIALQTLPAGQGRDALCLLGRRLVERAL